ncbi:MAG: hypothetical protein C0392_09920 [Syntrophus sp. (in: bacteria)]|nr:hypothetical protein [Syntrophus sp. (in: bacteria)]
MAVETVFFCRKYMEKVDIANMSCPHAQDFCKYRTGCIIHVKCMEDPVCREARRKSIENTR